MNISDKSIRNMQIEAIWEKLTEYELRIRKLEWKVFHNKDVYYGEKNG